MTQQYFQNFISRNSPCDIPPWVRAYFEPKRNIEDIVSGVSYSFFAFHTAVAYNYMPSFPQRLFFLLKNNNSWRRKKSAKTQPPLLIHHLSIHQLHIPTFEKKTPAFLQHFYIITYLFIQQCSMTYIFPTNQRDGHRLHESILYYRHNSINSIVILYKCIFTKVT